MNRTTVIRENWLAIITFKNSVILSFFYCSYILALKNKAAVYPHPHCILSWLFPMFNQWNLRIVDAMVLILYVDMKGSFLPGDSQNIIFNTFRIKCILNAHNDFSKYLQIAWKKNVYYFKWANWDNHCPQRQSFKVNRSLNHHLWKWVLGKGLSVGTWLSSR